MRTPAAKQPRLNLIGGHLLSLVELCCIFHCVTKANPSKGGDAKPPVFREFPNDSGVATIRPLKFRAIPAPI